MINQTNRTDTLLDIMHYMDAPIFKDRFNIFYENNSDSLILMTDDYDNIIFLLCNSNHDDAIPPSEIATLFNVPTDNLVYIQGSKIEGFADSLLERLLHELYQV